MHSLLTKPCPFKGQQNLTAAAENARRLRASSNNDGPEYEEDEQPNEDVFTAGLGTTARQDAG